MFIFTRTNLEEMVLALEGDATIFPAGFVLRLYTDNILPTQTSTPGSFTEMTAVDVPGYAPVAVTWDGFPARIGDGSWVDYLTDALFQASADPAVPITAFGWMLTDAAGVTLIAAGLLDVPFQFGIAGDGIRLEGFIAVSQTDDDFVRIGVGMEPS